MRLLSSLAALALALALLLPVPALASSVSASEIEHEGLGPKGESTFETHVRWSADPGEANRLQARWEEESRAVVLRDPAAPIRAGEGCATRADGSVACASPIWPAAVALDGDDGDDWLRLDGVDGVVAGGEGDDTLSTAGSGSTTLRGGAGADTIDGGPGLDSIEGGAGADTIDGGADGDTIVDDPPAGPYSADRIDGGPGGGDIVGVDTVVYDRPDGATVDLRAGTGGAPGEGDLIVGVEAAAGGSAADELRGSDGPDTLVGGGGADLLDGRGGSDHLFAAGPAAQLFGGAGNDVFYATAGAVSCGPGHDFVRNPRSATIADAASCERIVADMMFAALATRRAGRTLQLGLRGLFYSEPDRCGAFVSIRPAGGGRALAHRFVRLREGRLRPTTLVAARPLPARLRVELRGAYCSGARPQLRPQGGFDRDPPALLRFSVTLPLARR